MIRLTRKHLKKPFLQEMVVRFPVFSNFKITIVISNDTTAAAYYIADRDYTRDPGLGTNNEAFTVSSPDAGYSSIFLTPDANMGTIAHESYHAVCAMMKMIGANEEHEVVAYHLGFLVEKIVEFNLKVSGRFEKKREDVQKSQNRNEVDGSHSTDAAL